MFYQCVCKDLKWLPNMILQEAVSVFAASVAEQVTLISELKSHISPAGNNSGSSFQWEVCLAESFDRW